MTSLAVASASRRPGLGASGATVPSLLLVPSFLLLVLVAACGGPGDGGPGGEADATADPYDLLVENVRLVDVDAGAVVGPRTVAIRDGRIAAVWAPDEVPTDGANATREPGEIEADRRVNGEDRWLIPGLWDSHVHFRGGEALAEENRALLPLYPLNGVTTVRDTGGDLTSHLMAWRDSIAAGDLLGPRILLSGPKLDGPRPAWEGSIPVADTSEVDAAVDSLEALGVDFVKLYDGSMSHEVFMALVREAESRGMLVTGHMPLGVDFLESVRAGLDATEHLYYVFKGTAANREEVTRRVRDGVLGFWDGMEAAMGRRDPAAEREVFGAMADRGTAVVPTLHIGNVLAEVERVDHSDDPELAYITEELRETYAGRVESARSQPPEARETTRALREAMADLVLPMHEAGVPILAGSDAGAFNSYTYPGFALHDELEALVDAGLTPAEAIRTATTAPASFMGLGDELGRIAPGYRADLVLLDADPLADISNTRTVSTVILRGEEVLDRAALEEGLRSLAREVRAREVRAREENAGAGDGG